MSENAVFSSFMTGPRRVLKRGGARRGNELDVRASRGLSSSERWPAFTWKNWRKPGHRLKMEPDSMFVQTVPIGYPIESITAMYNPH